MLLAACGGGSSPSPNGGGSGDLGLTGEIVISGSSTVEPISSIVADDFKAANPNVDYAVDGPGTGDGMALLCDGSIDIADASRAIEEEEAAVCEENGINFVELQIGIDGISVITSPENTDVACLSFADLYALTGPESQGFDTWDAASGLPTRSAPATSAKCTRRSRDSHSTSSRRVRSPAPMTATYRS